MATANKPVRQSVTLPSNLASQVRGLARARWLSANRMLVELIENGIEAEKRREKEFFALAERFRKATDPEEVKRVGDEMGRMVFGRLMPKLARWVEFPEGVCQHLAERMRDGQGALPRTFLLRGQVARGVSL
jgi:hypothetical protein